MSGVTTSPTRQALAYHDRRAERIALAVVIVATALLVALVLGLGEGGSQTSPTSQPAATAKPSPTAPQGTRYDGGPEEGTRGTVFSGALPEGSRGLRR